MRTIADLLVALRKAKTDAIHEFSRETTDPLDGLDKIGKGADILANAVEFAIDELEGMEVE